MVNTHGVGQQRKEEVNDEDQEQYAEIPQAEESPAERMERLARTWSLERLPGYAISTGKLSIFKAALPSRDDFAHSVHGRYAAYREALSSRGQRMDVEEFSYKAEMKLRGIVPPTWQQTVSTASIMCCH